MKLLSSSSSFSSSSSSRFDSKGATPSYLAAILRRILCSGSLQTHPSDHVAEEANHASVECWRDFEADDKKAPSGSSSRETNPSLVARLMGLDSMPETNFRTSAAPTFFELHEEEFFVLSFEKATASRGFRRRGVRSELGFGETRQRRRVIGKREENKGGRMKSTSRRHCVDDVVSSYGAKVNPSLKKKKRTHSQVVKSLKTELNSEDCSPVSVLDCCQFLVDPKVPVSASSSRRKLSLETDGNLERPHQQRNNNSIEENEKSETEQEKYEGTRTTESESRESSNGLDDICGPSEAEFKWVQKRSFDDQDFQGIGGELEALIFGHLLQELVDQLLN